MLRSTPEEAQQVRDYFEGQAPDLTITFMQKIYSEAVLGHRHDVWDIHTDKDRWWVITDPTNLYSQEQFPNMDLAVTFHIGLCLRIPRTERQRIADRRIRPFGEAYAKLEEASDALSHALNTADYQAVGMRCREALIAFVSAAQDAVDWPHDGDAPKRADVKAWSEIICNAALPGDSNKARRRLLKSLFEEAWSFDNWLTHATSAAWHDAEAAAEITGQAIGAASSLVVRLLRGVPDKCPQCGSPHLSPEHGFDPAVPDILWERPCCDDCGWVGQAVRVGPDDGEGLIVREGEGAGDDHVFMTTPLRSIKRPGDAS